MGKRNDTKSAERRVTVKMSSEELDVLLSVDAAMAKRDNERPTIMMPAVKAG